MSQHIDPTPKQTDITSLNSNIAEKLSYVDLGSQNANETKSYNVPANSYYVLLIESTGNNLANALILVASYRNGIRGTEIYKGERTAISYDGNTMQITSQSAIRVFEILLFGSNITPI